jgi:hypothetical protein
VQIGIFCSSNRPHLWHDLYTSLSKNNVDFNLCISGPRASEWSLPGNVKYIQTNVKPAQCFFIAEQNTVGDYVMNVPDDATLSPGCLDDLVRIIDNKMTIVSPYYTRIIDQGSSHFMFPDKRVPKIKGRVKSITMHFPLPTCSMMYRDTFNNIGIDNSFIGVIWDHDMAFELVSRGGKVLISDRSTFSDLKTSGLCKTGGDHAHLTDMWFDGDTIRYKRKNFINPLVYSDDVLIVSQGRKGKKWP